MCYFALSYDLLLALRNPFTDYKLNRRFYFAAIVVRMGVAGVMVAVPECALTHPRTIGGKLTCAHLLR